MAAGFAGQHYVGLDYAAAEVLMRSRGILDQEQAFGDLRAMERAVLPILNGKDESTS